MTRDGLIASRSWLLSLDPGQVVDHPPFHTPPLVLISRREGGGKRAGRAMKWETTDARTNTEQRPFPRTRVTEQRRTTVEERGRKAGENRFGWKANGEAPTRKEIIPRRAAEDFGTKTERREGGGGEKDWPPCVLERCQRTGGHVQERPVTASPCLLGGEEAKGCEKCPVFIFSLVRPQIPQHRFRFSSPSHPTPSPCPASLSRSTGPKRDRKSAV